MLNVTFDIAGEQQYVRSFEAFDEELRDLRDPLGDVADHLQHVVGEQFLTEGAHGLGLRWVPLNPEYAAWKREHYPGAPLLVRTGAMRDALITDGTRELTAHSLRWGITTQTDDEGQPIREYAIAHQTGRGVVPQRKIIALGSMDRRQIDRIFVTWLHNLRRALFGAQR